MICVVKLMNSRANSASTLPRLAGVKTGVLLADLPARTQYEG